MWKSFTSLPAFLLSHKYRREALVHTKINGSTKLNVLLALILFPASPIGRIPLQTKGRGGAERGDQ